MNQTPPSPSVIASLLPLLIISAVLFVFLLGVAKQKGKSRAVALWAFVPFVNGLVALWLCSLTDAAVLARLAALESKG
jgi:hypothetical protein